jgi:hypothetical protein
MNNIFPLYADSARLTVYCCGDMDAAGLFRFQ